VEYYVPTKLVKPSAFWALGMTFPAMVRGTTEGHIDVAQAHCANV